MHNRRVLLLLVFTFLPNMIFSENLKPDQRSKLHPEFRSLITKGTPDHRQIKGSWVMSLGKDPISGENLYPCIIHTRFPGVISGTGIHLNSVYSGFGTARLTKQEIIKLAGIYEIDYIEPGGVEYPLNDIARGMSGVPPLSIGLVNETAYTGADVLICIIDSGIDWTHKDFCDPADTTQSRILYLWDQTNTPDEPGENNPAGFNYGIEYTQNDIENELDGSPAGFVEEQDISGHGTHVAGTAAGNGAASPDSNKYAGMALEANLIIVKAGNGSFPTTNIIDGLTYANNIGNLLGKPVVVNMSLGSNSGAHDGTDAKSQAIDDFCGAGRVVVTSAGNSGGDTIHISGTTASTDSSEIIMAVPAEYDTLTGANNDDFILDTWFSGNGAVTAKVLTPNGHELIRTANDDTTLETADGTIYIYNFIDFNNGDRRVYVRIYDGTSVIIPASGNWTVRLINNSAGSMTHHGWLFDSGVGNKQVSLVSGDSDYTLSNTADKAIIVGSYVHRWYWMSLKGGYYGGIPDRSDDISAFSSIGPTRDSRQKPDITAPGEKMASSMSSFITNKPDSTRIVAGNQHYLTQGTSMAAPVVTGIVGLLLQQNSMLTATEIRTLLTSSTTTDDFTGLSLPDYQWGYGKVNAFRALVKAVNPAFEADHQILAYDDWSNGTATWPSNSEWLSVRFTPVFHGQTSGVLFMPGSSGTLTGPLHVEIRADQSGNPGTQLGNTIQLAANKLVLGTWNYINLFDAGVNVTAGTDYHLVLYPSSGTMSVMVDNDGSVSGRCKKSPDGSTWQLWYDYHIRPVITRHGVLLQAKLFLQGPYDTSSDQMNDDLCVGGYLPLTSPYTHDSRSVLGIPDHVVDWVLIQLRETESGPAIESKSAFLHQDGRIVGDDGVSPFISMEAAPGNYYIVVKHRNHLSGMSSNVHTLLGDASVLYDFTGSGQLYGSNGGLELESGIWGLWNGDINQDGQVTTLDYTDWYQSNHSGETGYVPTDVDLNTAIDNTDYHIWNEAARLKATSNVP